MLAAGYSQIQSRFLYVQQSDVQLSIIFSNILYLWHQGIYNLSKQNSLCFGKISKFPVFSLTGNCFGHFPCFPCAVGTLSL